MKTMTLKSGSLTKSQNLMVSTLDWLSKVDAVYIDAVGPIANYNVTKALILIKGQLAIIGERLVAEPIFTDIFIENPTDGIENKIGIRWVLRKQAAF